MLALRLIGEFELELDGVELAPPSSRRATALLAWLALHPGPHPRSRLAALFWPDVLDAGARASLRSAVWALRGALGPAGAAHLLADRETVALAGEDLRVDVREFDRLADAGQEAEAIALCRGDLLSGFDEDWAYQAREEHDSRLAAVLATQVRRAEKEGRPDDALVAARRLLELRPLDEPACRDVMRLLTAGGDPRGALEVCSRVRRRVRSELGCDLSPQTGALAAEIAAAIPAPAPAPAAVPSATSAANPTPAAVPAPPLIAAPVSVSWPAPERPLLGRRAELGSLREHWRAAQTGRGSVVVLGGEGGIGKTRLCEELQAYVGRSDALTVSATADGPAGGSPFAVWSEALADLVSAAELDDRTVGSIAELARILPALPINTHTLAPTSARPVAEPPLERVRLFEAVVDLVGRAARDRTLLLILEDLHQADPSSVELAGYLGRRIARRPVLLVLTRRKLPPRPDLESTLAALRARGALRLTLDLGPLADPTVRRLVEATADLDPAAVAQITAASGGSPLIAVEAALACARGAETALGLAEAVHAAVYRLSRPARALVELLAVAGRDVAHADLLALPLPAPERAETEALGADLLRMHAGSIGFRHALLAEAVYQDLPGPDRARLHETFAELLRRRGGGPDGGRRAAEIAHHLRMAGRDEAAAGQLALAAGHARLVAALPEAAGFLRAAARLRPHDPELLVELAEVEAWRGLPEESAAAFARALELIPPDDDGSLVSAWLRRGRWLRGGVCHPQESRRSYRSALDVLDRDPQADPLARAEALAGLAWAEAVVGSADQCETLLREVSEILGVRSGPNDLLTHDVGVARAHALLRAGRFREAYPPLIAAAAAAGRAGRPDMAYSCLINAASAAACAGEFERALDFAERCLPLVEPNGLLRLSVYAHSARAAVLRRLSRLDEAAEAIRAEAAYAERLGRPELAGLADHDLGLLALARADWPAAAADLARAMDLNAPVSHPLARLCRAEALARAGRCADAETELRATALEPVHPGDFADTLVARMNRVQGLIAAAQGDTATARRRLDQAATGWRRRIRTGGDEAGRRYVAALIDLGRPPLSSLTEPDRELASIEADLATLADPAQPAALPARED